MPKNLALGVVVLLATLASADSQTYTVQQGDTVLTIAKHFNVPSKAIVSANKIDSPLVPGTVLQIPDSLQNSAPYVVKDGESDWMIAHRFATTLSLLKTLNPGVNLSVLQAGTTINVPKAAAKEEQPSVKSRFAVVTGNHAIVRNGPSTAKAKVAMVDSGTKATVLDFEGGWYKLKFQKGTAGWIRGDLIKPVSDLEAATPAKTVVASASASSGDSAEALLQKAYDLKGTRYHYGGVNTKGGLDCSGFTSKVFREEGIKLPRTSRDQSRVGSAVSRGSLEPGDLVFFATRGRGRISHVGIYTGDGKFIHSASSHGVRVDSLSEAYYAKRLSTARRVARFGRSELIKDRAEAAKGKKVAKTKDAALPKHAIAAPAAPSN